MSIAIAIPALLLVAAEAAVPPDAALAPSVPIVEQAAPPLADDARMIVHQVIVETQVVIRVPARSRMHSFSPASPDAHGSKPDGTIVWKESKSRKCVPMKAVNGVQISRENSVDLLTVERERLRARLADGCRTQDFYAGFYMRESSDGMLCRDRDEIQARSGTKCRIESMRLMVPVLVRD